MAITIKNILVGEGALSLAPTTTGTLTNLGATQDGAEIAWEPSMVDIEVDQFGDAAKVVQNRVKCMLKTKLAEATMVNLAYAWGYNTGLTGDTATATTPGVQTAVGSPGSGTQTFNLGIHGTYPNERKLQLVGNAPGSDATTTFARTYTCNRVVSYNSSAHMLKRSENVAFPIEFRVLPDPTQTGKEYGTIVDAF